MVACLIPFCGGYGLYHPPILAERRVVGQFTHTKKNEFFGGAKIGRYFLELTEAKR